MLCQLEVKDGGWPPVTEGNRRPTLSASFTGSARVVAGVFLEDVFDVRFNGGLPMSSSVPAAAGVR
jgi:hypothetical protein